MKKFKLEIAELRVDTFDVDGAAVNPHGTVRGHDSFTADTYCFGECVTGSISGCDTCNPTPDCTGNIHDFHCHDSLHYCDATIQVTSCVDMCD